MIAVAGGQMDGTPQATLIYMDSLIEILRAEGRSIAEEFNLACLQGKGTSQEVSDFREHAIQGFLARFLPKNHIVSKGKITDLDGNQSASIDCLILNPAHPNLIDSQGKFRLIFSDGCDAAIEVKPDLARVDELHRALKQGVSVKQVPRSKSPLPLHRTQPAHIIEESQRVPFFVFAVKAFDPSTLHREILAYYTQNEIPPEHQLDAVCINGVGMIKNIKHPELNLYTADPPLGRSAGWYLESWGESACLGFLLSLEYSYPSAPTISESILRRVLTRIGKTHVNRLGDDS